MGERQPEPPDDVPDRDADARPPGPPRPGDPTRDDELAAGIDEPLAQALDLSTWRDGVNLAADVGRLEREIAEAARQEDDVHKAMRDRLLPEIDSPRRLGKPKGAGVVQVTATELIRAQHGLLFTGAVEAASGVAAAHETLPLTIAQVGVAAVSYLGSRGAWGHRLFYRDLRLRGGMDSVTEMLELLHRRSERSAAKRPGARDELSELARRGILSYAERAVLVEKTDANAWLLGRGHPAPYELITGSGSMELLRLSLDMLRRLILDRRKFVFIASRPTDLVLPSIGGALLPGQFAIVDRDEMRTRPIVEEGNLRGEHRERAMAFVDEAIGKVVAGVYRVGRHSPPQVFYAHEDHAEEAALIAMADSLLQPFRSFPTLLDLSSSIVSSLFGPESFEAIVQQAYARGEGVLRFAGGAE